MSFQDIKGQDKTIRLLKEHIGQSRVVGGYLFVGPEGVGKNMAAKILAKALNCEEGTPDSCDKCISCLKIEKNQHPDVHSLDAYSALANNYETQGAIKIEEIRQLQREINLKPYEGKKKVFIINNAHHLTAEAANALLKILEEPPVDSLIILVTSKPALLFKTIISRCQIFKFYPLKRTELEEILKKDYGLNYHKAHFISYFCEGRIGRALRTKDIDIMQTKNTTIDAFAIFNEMRMTNTPIENRDRLRGQLNILATWFRDIYLIKIGMPHSELINIDRKKELLQFMHRYSFVNLDEIFRNISEALLYLEQNVNVRLLLANLKLSLRG